MFSCMKKNRIKSTIRFIVDCLAKRHYTSLYTSSQFYPDSYELPQVDLERALLDYGGNVTATPTQDYRIDLIRQIDLPGKLFADILLWLDNEESDLTLQCTLYTDDIVDDLYRFTITDLDVL